MSIFCYKKIDTSKNLGWELKTAREAKELSIEEAAKKTQIPLKYLEALENNRFFDLPKAKSHRQAYMRELCKLYNLNFEDIAYKFDCEGGLKLLTKSYFPIEGQLSNRAETAIQGETDKESQLEVNGKEIKVNEQGKFNDVILLSNGVNTITLSTTKKHGKTTTVTRHVVVMIKEPARVSLK